MPALREDSGVARLVRASPAAPTFQLPPGAVDAHCHVFGPGAEFPTRRSASTRRATPARRPLRAAQSARLLPATSSYRPPATATTTGPWTMPAERAVARREAWRPCAASSATRRSPSCTPRAFAGCDSISSSGWSTSPRATSCRRLAGRIRPLGWHVVVYFEAQDLPELWEFFAALPTTVVVDHMGRPDVRKPIGGAEFRLFLDLMRRAPEHLDEGQLPGAPLFQRSPGGKRRTRAVSRRGAFRPGAWSRPFRIGCCGEAIGPTRT